MADAPRGGSGRRSESSLGEREVTLTTLLVEHLKCTGRWRDERRFVFFAFRPRAASTRPALDALYFSESAESAKPIATPGRSNTK